MQTVPGGRPGADVIARGGNNTWAPDIIRVGDKYFLYYSAPGTQPKSAIGLLVGKTLDPSSPDYGWTDAGRVPHHRTVGGHRRFEEAVISQLSVTPTSHLGKGDAEGWRQGHQCYLIGDSCNRS